MIVSFIRVFQITAANIKARHELLEGAIGVLPEEETAYKWVNQLSWILPIVVITGALLDMLLVYVYMKFAHPWKYILSFKAENEGEELRPNSSKNDEDKSGQNSEATIEEIFDNVQKEILARKAIRDEAHTAILHWNGIHSEYQETISYEIEVQNCDANNKNMKHVIII